MKQPARTIDLVERQIAIAEKKNQPRVLAKLQKELAELQANRPVKVVPKHINACNMKVYDNKAAFLFYNDKSK